MVKTRIPAKFKLEPICEIQVLCPMKRGSLGIRELNVRLQAELNPVRPDEPSVDKFGWQFRPRDKVIQTENDYEKDVFNGVTIRFDQREVVYDYGELDEVSLAYAITLLKAFTRKLDAWQTAQGGNPPARRRQPEQGPALGNPGRDGW
jgi:exodeoxyribonuclease V alpha subunit